MERPIVAVEINKDSLECEKLFTSGKTSVSVFYDIAEFCQFSKGCDFLMYRDILPQISKMMEAEKLNFDLSGVRVFDLLSLEEALESRSLQSLKDKYSCESITGVFRAQKEILDMSPDSLDKICSEGTGRLDASGRIKLVDGVAVWNQGRLRGKAVVNHLDYAQVMLEQGIPEDTKNVIKKLFSR